MFLQNLHNLHNDLLAQVKRGWTRELQAPQELAAPTHLQLDLARSGCSIVITTAGWVNQSTTQVWREQDILSEISQQRWSKQRSIRPRESWRTAVMAAGVCGVGIRTGRTISTQETHKHWQPACADVHSSLACWFLVRLSATHNPQPHSAGEAAARAACIKSARFPAAASAWVTQQ
jgi:hypothetical protein